MGAEIHQVNHATIRITLNDMVAIDFDNRDNPLRAALLVQLICCKFQHEGVDLDRPACGSLHIREVIDPVVLCEIDWQRGESAVNLDDRKTQKTLGRMIDKLVRERTGCDSSCG